MTVDLDALEALAKTATPGPWTESDDDGEAYSRPPATGAFLVEYGADAEQKMRDIRYIAATNPSTVLALIAELRQERERADKRVGGRELARIALTAKPLVECPHWEPGKITFRNGCTACAEQEGRTVRRRGYRATRQPRDSESRAMIEDIKIPRPHVPHGPAGVPEALADADYLDSAARNIEGGYAIGGYNVTSTVIKLLHDTATALRQWEHHGKHWWACAVNAPRPEMVDPCDCDLSRAADVEIGGQS